MSSLSSLVKDTAIYGLSSIIGRFLNYLLVPLYTTALAASTGGYGVITEVYSYVALLLVLLTFGMETTFFRFVNKTEEDPMRVYATTLIAVGGVGLLFVAAVLGLLPQIAAALVRSTGSDAEWVGALPTALMKPLSGSGARGMMVDAMQTFGADSFAGRLSCIFQGSTDTTFYILAVYFGSVGVSRTRHAVGCGLAADLAGMIAAVFIAYLFF